MKNRIIQFGIDNEADLVLAHKRAIQIAELTGLSISDQTRFATAVSEISRNCLEYAQDGSITFSVREENPGLALQAEIKDEGPGINDLQTILSQKEIDGRLRGTGILNSRKLVDVFDIKSVPTGTTVVLLKRIPAKPPPINNMIIQGWHKHFTSEMSASPYEEIKHRNMKLLEFADQLKAKKLEADIQVEEISKLNKILESKNENLKQVAYAIAHDLKNPISSIKLACEVILSSDDTDERNRFVNMVQKNADRLLGIINDLQKTIDHDPDIAIKADQLNLNIIATELQEQFSSYLDKPHGTIQFSFTDTDIIYPKVYINSILTNLISNAIKYASEAPLRVNVTGQRNKKYFELRIEDNGIGIDLAKYEKQLFKPFNRFTEQGEGKGMGLNIVHYIITKNGGEIKIESEPGKGTTFLCFLKEYV